MKCDKCGDPVAVLSHFRCGKHLCAACYIEWFRGRASDLVFALAFGEPPSTQAVNDYAASQGVEIERPGYQDEIDASNPDAGCGMAFDQDDDLIAANLGYA